jgi:hypothetical protein
VKELTQEIEEHEEFIKEKKKKIAAIKESYRLASDFTSRTDSQGLYVRHNVGVAIDKEMLRECFFLEDCS